MKTTRKAIPGEVNYQRPGYFIVDGIITYRCDSCFQHMSLFGYEVDKTGKVTPDIVCPNCKATHVDVRLSTYEGKPKKKNELRLK